MIAVTASKAKPRQRAATAVEADADVEVSGDVSVQAAINACAFPSAFTAACNAALSAALICLALVGCVGPPSVPNQQARASAFRNPAMSIESASAAIAIGTSTHADVLAALGSGTVVKFDSGFEIWVYRDTPSRTATRPAELVILFSPSGIVTKTRIKPPY